MGKRGPKAKIETIDRDQLKALILSGWTNAQLAKFFKVTPDCVQKWFQRYPELAECVRDWKAEADRVIEKSLYRRGKGYSHREDKIFLGPGGKPVIVPTTKHYPPDPASMIFWLKNRQPETWRDKQDIDLSDNRMVKDVLDALPEAIRDKVTQSLKAKTTKKK